MASTRAVRIGILSPATPNRPHFKSLENILPPGVSITHEGLGLLGESYQDLAGKEEVIVGRAAEFVKKHKVEGLMLTGGFITLFNPGIEAKVERDSIAPRKRDIVCRRRSDCVESEISIAHDALRSRIG
jgi:hypothetical protein